MPKPTLDDVNTSVDVVLAAFNAECTRLSNVYEGIDLITSLRIAATVYALAVENASRVLDTKYPGSQDHQREVFHAARELVEAAISHVQKYTQLSKEDRDNIDATIAKVEQIMRGGTLQ